MGTEEQRGSGVAGGGRGKPLPYGAYAQAALSVSCR